MTYKYEGGKSLSAITRLLDFAVSTANTIVKDAARIKEHVSFSFHLLHVCRPPEKCSICLFFSSALYY
jgi:hypothetical protein